MPLRLACHNPPKAARAANHKDSLVGRVAKVMRNKYPALRQTGFQLVLKGNHASHA